MFTEQFVTTLADMVSAKIIAGISVGHTEKQLYTVPEAAAYIGRTRQAVYHMISQGKLKVVRDGQRVFIEKRELDRWIESNRE
jgi:excisionase family DNA binding protein